MPKPIIHDKPDEATTGNSEVSRAAPIISDVSPATDDTALRNVLLAGLRNNQFEIKEGHQLLNSGAFIAIIQKAEETPGSPKKAIQHAISDVSPATDTRALRSVLLAGLRNKQFDFREGHPVLKEDASIFFLGRLASAVRESIVLTPGITPAALNRSRIYKEKSGPAFASILAEIKAATIKIDAKAAQLGGSLGNPVTGVEFGGKDLEIAFRKYEGGAIYVTHHGTFEVHGFIYQKYVELGSEKGFLGFPTTDEQGTTLGTGRFNHFERGSIYWTHHTGAWSIHGPIRDKWWQMDGDRSHIGFPTSDVEAYGGVPGDKISHFQRGSIVYKGGETHSEVYKDTVMLTTSIGSSSVGCQVELTMNSFGDWHYKGHMHNSGFIGFNVTVMSSPRFQDAAGHVFARTVERHLDGTTSLGSERSDDWDESGIGEPFIRDNWDFIKHAGMRTVIDVNTTFGAMVELIGAGLPIAVIVIIGAALAGGGSACGPYGRMRRNPETGLDEPSVHFEVVPKGEPCPNH